MRIHSNYEFQISPNAINRLVPLNAEHNPFASGNKGGIRTYGKFIGFILALFGKSVRLEDSTHRVYYVNKNSLKKWLQEHSGAQSTPIDLKKPCLDSVLNQLAEKAGKKQAPEPKNEPERVEKDPKDAVDAYNGKTRMFSVEQHKLLFQHLNCNEQELKTLVEPLTVCVRTALKDKDYVYLDSEKLGMSIGELKLILGFLLKQGEIKAMCIPYEGTGIDVVMNNPGFEPLEKKRKPYLEAILADKDKTMQSWNIAQHKNSVETISPLNSLDSFLARMRQTALPTHVALWLIVPPDFKLYDAFKLMDAIKIKIKDVPLFDLSLDHLIAAFPAVTHTQIEAALRYGLEFSMILAYRKTPEGFEVAASPEEVTAMREDYPGACIIEKSTLSQFATLDRLIPLAAKKTTQLSLESIAQVASAMAAFIGLNDSYKLDWTKTPYSKEQIEIAMRLLVISEKIKGYYSTETSFYIYQKDIPDHAFDASNFEQCLKDLDRIEHIFPEGLDAPRRVIWEFNKQVIQCALLNYPGRNLQPLIALGSNNDKKLHEVLDVMVKQGLIWGWNIVKETNETVFIPTAKDVDPFATKDSYVFQEWRTKQMIAANQR